MPRNGGANLPCLCNELTVHFGLNRTGYRVQRQSPQ